jgi:hypothetical protein
VVGQAPDADLADELESSIYRRVPQEWEKYPDAPLGEVIANKSRKRTIMRKHGGRKALVTRTPLKSEE